MVSPTGLLLFIDNYHQNYVRILTNVKVGSIMKRKVKSKCSSQTIFLCLAFLLGLLPISVQANGDAIEISTIAQFYDIENCLDCDYVLVSDLDFSDASNQQVNDEYYDETRGWAMIGRSTPFTGTFDGNNHIINGFTVSDASLNDVGLFSIVQYASIKNIVLKNVSIVGKDKVGGLVGYARYDTSIENVSVSGSVEGNFYVGGVVGDLYRSTLDQMYSQAFVSGPGSSVGGVVGRVASESALTNAHSIASVQGFNCSKATQISCSVGGIIGTTISGTSVSSAFFNGELYHDVLLTSIEDKRIYAKPIIGNAQNTNNTNLYYHFDSDIFEDLYIESNNLTNISSYIGFDFDLIWGIEDTAYLQQANSSLFLPKIESIVVSQYPRQMEFDEDEVINLDGLQVKVINEDSSEIILEDDDYEKFIDRENQTVKIRYKEFETTFDIIINPVFYYAISVIEKGFGGNIHVSINDTILDLTQKIRQGSNVDIVHEMHDMGRIESVVINKLPHEGELLTMDSDKNIEVKYYLLGDNNADTVLNDKDLMCYPSLLKNQVHNKTTDTNEDNQTTISDFVTLRNHIVESNSVSIKSLETKSTDLAFELVDYIYKEKRINVSIKVNSNNVGAFYSKPILINAISWSITSSDAQVMFDADNEGLIVSPKESETQLKDSFLLEFVIIPNETMDFLSLIFSDTQYSDVLGESTTFNSDKMFALTFESTQENPEDQIVEPDDETTNNDNQEPEENTEIENSQDNEVAKDYKQTNEDSIPALGYTRSVTVFIIVLCGILLMGVSRLRKSDKIN